MPHRGPFGGFDEDDDDYDDYSDDDEYYYDDEEDEDIDFYMCVFLCVINDLCLDSDMGHRFLFEELLRGRANRYAHSRVSSLLHPQLRAHAALDYHHAHPGAHPSAPRKEPYDPDRPRRDREARETAEARRQKEAAARRAAAERDRIQGMPLLASNTSP